MKLLIASDIHGSAYYTEKFLNVFNSENCDKLLLLGDILYHGPRNPLPEGYAPQKVVELLTAVKEKIVCVRGNCDAEVDQMVLPFPITSETALVCADGVNIYLTHGHKFNPDNPMPLEAGSVMLFGHTHVPFPKSLTDDLAPTDRILNAGTHAQTDVNCNTEGLCFIVGIKEDRTVCAKRFVSGNIRFYRKSISLRAGEAIEQIERELAGLPEGSAVDLILEGAVTAEEYEALPADVERLLSRFTEGTYSISAVSKLISEELIDAEFPETSFPAMLLKALLGEPKEAQLTYELLKSLKEGK